jgi:membrane-bound metal-dependent hydrolase YbcI (DUF457 family)
VILGTIHYKLINIFLLVGFILSRLIDYTTTYIMLLLGCKEGNWLVRICVDKFGSLKGLVVSTTPAFLLVIIITHFVLRHYEESKQQFALFVLVLIIFYSLIVALGNVSGLAIVVHMIQN